MRTGRRTLSGLGGWPFDFANQVKVRNSFMGYPEPFASSVVGTHEAWQAAVKVQINIILSDTTWCKSWCASGWISSGDLAWTQSSLTTDEEDVRSFPCLSPGGTGDGSTR